MILEKLCNKLNPTKNIHRSTWKGEIEGVIIGLARNLALEKFQGIHKDDPS